MLYSLKAQCQGTARSRSHFGLVFFSSCPVFRYSTQSVTLLSCSTLLKLSAWYCTEFVTHWCCCTLLKLSVKVLHTVSYTFGLLYFSIAQCVGTVRSLLYFWLAILSWISLSRYCTQSVTLWPCCIFCKPSVKVLYTVCYTLGLLYFLKV